MMKSSHLNRFQPVGELQDQEVAKARVWLHFIRKGHFLIKRGEKDGIEGFSLLLTDSGNSLVKHRSKSWPFNVAMTHYQASPSHINWKPDLIGLR